MSSESELIPLKGGLAVPLSALRLLWDLEDRGLVIERTERGTLLVGPRDQLTDHDRTAIREHRDALVQLVAYCDEAIA